MTIDTQFIIISVLVLFVVVGLTFAMITHFGKVKLKDFASGEKGGKPSLLTGQRYITKTYNPRNTMFYTSQAHCDLEQKHCTPEEEVTQMHSEMPEPLNCNDCFSRKHTHY